MSTDAFNSSNDGEPTSRDRRSVAEMLGEVFREGAVLLAVFIPLDLFVQGHPLTAWSIAAIVVIPATLLTIGIAMERWRS